MTCISSFLIEASTIHCTFLLLTVVHFFAFLIEMEPVFFIPCWSMLCIFFYSLQNSDLHFSFFIEMLSVYFHSLLKCGTCTFVPYGNVIYIFPFLIQMSSVFFPVPMSLFWMVQSITPSPTHPWRIDRAEMAFDRDQTSTARRSGDKTHTTFIRCPSDIRTNKLPLKLPRVKDAFDNPVPKLHKQMTLLSFCQNYEGLTFTRFCWSLQGRTKWLVIENSLIWLLDYQRLWRFFLEYSKSRCSLMNVWNQTSKLCKWNESQYTGIEQEG